MSFLDEVAVSDLETLSQPNLVAEMQGVVRPGPAQANWLTSPLLRERPKQELQSRLLFSPFHTIENLGFAFNVIHPTHQLIIVANNCEDVGCARSGEFGPWPSASGGIEAVEPGHERWSST